MKLNLTVRAKNPYFWFQILLSVATPMLTYYGLTGSDFTTWGKVFEVIANAISNPYVVFTMIVGVWNALTDPTTKGFGDSEQALTYTEPK